MNFPSDSWGKFSKEVEFYMKDMDGTETAYTKLGNIEELKYMATDIFSKPIFSNLSRLEQMKQILEGIRMPVQNPKTGEEDYVDVSLVNKIVVDSQYVEDMKTNNKVKVDVSINGDAEAQRVSVIIKNKNLNINISKSMPLQSFEEMLFKAINEVQTQRLEDVPEFETVLKELVSSAIDNGLKKGQYLARLDRGLILDKGIGIIRDTKTDQQIGTYESASFLYEKSRRTVTFDDIILSGRTFDELKETDRFEFSFYSLNNEAIYSIMIGSNAIGKPNANISKFSVERFDIIIDAFDEKHAQREMVTLAQANKSLIEGMDESHPLYASNNEKFRQSRLDILEESKNQQKKQKLVNKYADIDLDF